MALNSLSLAQLIEALPLAGENLSGLAKSVDRVTGKLGLSNAHEQQAHIGGVFRSKQTAEIAFRVIFGPIFLQSGVPADLLRSRGQEGLVSR